jgi:hypothetical protein
MYPKDYSLQVIETEQNTAFVIMPYKKEFEQIYGEICEVCLDLKIDCKRTDEVFSSKSIVETILEKIAKAEIIIADLSEKNSNVYYELGIAHTLRDEDAVILITGDKENSPFDINHRYILAYDKRNLMKFRSDLKRKIIFSRSISRKKEFFKSYLLNNGIRKGEIEIFIDVSDKLSQAKLEVIFDLINSNEKEFKESDIESLFEFFTQLEDYQAGAIRKSALLFKMQVYTSTIILNRYDYLAKKLLARPGFDLIQLDNFEHFHFIAEFCFRLIEIDKLKQEALEWIVNYLTNYRMGRIDIIRTKIENFLIKVNDKDVDAMILHMLQSSSITVRESAADICGQKGLLSGIPFLTTLIKTEENPHVVRSCITALTRLKAYESAEVIHEWMIQNRDKWGEQAVSASLKNIALVALRELDKSKLLLEKFEEFVSSK